MKRIRRTVLQNLTIRAAHIISNFGHLLTLMVDMGNVGSDNKGPGNGRGIDFSNADPLFLEYAQKDLKPEIAVEILKKHGMQVSVTQAKSILEFLQKLADITVTQYLEK